MRAHYLLICAAVLGGCSDDNDDSVDVTSGTPEAAAIDMGNSHGAVLVAQAHTDFPGGSGTDTIARAADVVSTINLGEIMMSAYVLQTDSADSDVDDMASDIRDDHQNNQDRLQSFEQDRQLPPADTKVGNTIDSEAQMSMAQLQATAPADLGLVYIKMQVAMHQEAYVIVSNLRDDYVQDDDFRDYLSDTLDTIASHRDHAIDLLRDRD